MALVRTLSKGLRKTPRQGGTPGDVDGPTVTISGYPTDPTDDTTPTFTFSANESGCTFEYKINAGAYAACTSPLTLAAQTDGAYTIYIRATDKQGNVGSAATYSWDLVTAYAGTLPSTVAALNGWSLASPWTLLYNFDGATVNPTVPPSVAPGSVAHGLIKWGSDATATKTTDGQSGYADQSGYTVNTNQDFVIQYASAAWKFSATVPTCYLMTFKMASTPASVQTILGGSDGLGGGWYLEAHETAGIRAMIGTGAVYVAMSHVGGTSFYDNEYHTVLLVIDDASGKAKLYTEFGNTESTSMTIATTDAICTIGPIGTPYHWSAPTTYLTVARGEHPLLYTNAQSLFDEYEDARLNNVNQTAIASLPSSLSELTGLSGFSEFTNAYTILSSASSVAPVTGSAGPTMAPNTGVLHSATNGTTPTLGPTGSVRTGFTAQRSVQFDSTYDNLTGADALPDAASAMVLLLVFRGAASYVAANKCIIGNCSSTRGWNFNVNSTGSITYGVINAGTTQTYATVSTNAGKDGLWHTALLACQGNNGGVAGELSMSIDAVTPTDTTVIANTTNPTSTEYWGAMPPNIQTAAPLVNPTIEIAHVSWVQSPSAFPNAAARASMLASFRWRYGL